MANLFELTNYGMTAAQVLARSKKARRTGRWPEWRKHAIQPGHAGNGWAAEFDVVHENGVFSVLVRQVTTAWGTILHAMISSASNATDLTWSEKQRVKDELFGLERTAIEVFPARSQLTDAANSYHLWILPDDFELPFTISTQRAA